jgi:hypothetical protein
VRGIRKESEILHWNISEVWARQMGWPPLPNAAILLCLFELGKEI